MNTTVNIIILYSSKAQKKKNNIFKIDSLLHSIDKMVVSIRAIKFTITNQVLFERVSSTGKEISANESQINGITPNIPNPVIILLIMKKNKYQAVQIRN